MKRYKLHSVVLSSPQTGFKPKLFEDDQGEWVKYEDVKDCLNKTFHKPGQLYECYQEGDKKYLVLHESERCNNCNYVWNSNGC